MEKLVLCLMVISALNVLMTEAGDKKLQIGIKKRIPEADCKIKSKKGDTLSMHYTVS